MNPSLRGKTIIVTRTREQASGFAKLLRSYGARVLSCPTIKIVPPLAYQPMDRAIRAIDSYDWLIFTSANAVRHFMKRFRKREFPKHLKTFAIGLATAQAMNRSKIRVTKISDDYVAESILDTLPNLSAKKVLIPRAREAREILPAELRKQGADVHVVPAYRTILDSAGARKLKGWLSKSNPDCVTFTSSSTVKNFFKTVRVRPKSALAASIGPITTKTLLKHGWKPAIVAKKPTTRHLAQAIAHYFNGGQR